MNGCLGCGKNVTIRKVVVPVGIDQLPARILSGRLTGSPWAYMCAEQVYHCHDALRVKIVLSSL